MWLVTPPHAAFPMHRCVSTRSTNTHTFTYSHIHIITYTLTVTRSHTPPARPREPESTLALRCRWSPALAQPLPYFRLRPATLAGTWGVEGEDEDSRHELEAARASEPGVEQGTPRAAPA